MAELIFKQVGARIGQSILPGGIKLFGRADQRRTAWPHGRSCHRSLIRAGARWAAHRSAAGDGKPRRRRHAKCLWSQPCAGAAHLGGAV